MTERDLLMGEDKEKLVDEIIHLRKLVKDLVKRIEDLENRLAKSTEPKKSEEPPSPKKRSHPPEQWGRKAGHKGCTRPTPEHIDQEVEQSLETCPDCHHPFEEPIESIEHIQEDIIPARVEVTKFIRHRYWCSCCKKIVTAPYAANEIPQGYLGPQALATMVWLKYHCALPGNKIKSIFEDLCGLAVSEGAIAQALQRLSAYLNTESQYILDVLKNASYKHVDETGWNINGAIHWLWSVVNGQWAFTHIDASRGSRVPKELLGHPFNGIVVSDFFSAYNCLQGRKQKCLVHLRREIRNARSEDPPEDFLLPQKKLNRLLDDAKRLADRRHTFSRLLFARRTRLLKKRLFDFAFAEYSHPFWQRLSKRLAKHQDAIFTFLDVPGLSADNNPAERSIKPHVIIRNRSYQNRTPNGALAHSVLSSIVQTLILQKRNVMPDIAAAYTIHRQGLATNSTLFNSKR